MSNRIPPRDALAEVVAHSVTAHTEWDSLHEFLTLHWDGEKISVGTLAAIDPGMPPGSYPSLMAKLTRDAIAEQHEKGERTLYAYLLKFEAHAVLAPDESDPAADRAQFERDRRDRRFHQRADAVEIVSACCVDIHGRMWTATKQRTKPDDIEQHFYADPTGAPGGAFISGLRAIAGVTGFALHGQPLPSGPGEAARHG